MATFGGAVDLILTELGRADTSITAVTEREVLKAIEHYSPTRFWFNEARASFTASNTIYYAIDTIFPATASFMPGFLEIDQVSALISSSVVELDRESHQELQRIDVSGFTGPPCKWAVWAEQLRLYPKCASGSSNQIDVFGTRRLATLSASTESNAWTNAGLSLISARVQKMLNILKFKDYDAARACEVIEQEQLQKLLDRSERYVPTGRISSGY